MTPEEHARRSALLSAIWRTPAEQLSPERVLRLMEEILEERRERVRLRKQAMNVPVNPNSLRAKVKTLGGAEKLAVKLGVSRSAVYAWGYQSRLPGWALDRINQMLAGKATS